MKVQLFIPKRTPPRDTRYGWATTNITQMLPFYRPFKTLGGKPRYTHRVRSANAHWRDGKISHISVTYWCGNNGFPGSKGDLLSHAPEDGVLCATCEGRAIGAGMDGARLINNREVIYSPRNTNE